MSKVFTTDFQHRVGTQTVTQQGFILADIIIARTGVLDYFGWQIKRLDQPDKIFKIYRPESALNNKETMDSFKLAPFTVDHPSGENAPNGMLNPSNVKEFAEGTLTESIKYENGLLKGQVLITTDNAQRALKVKKESSMGFFSSYDFVPGVTPDGVAFDGTQKEIEGNHVALVESGRSGDKCIVLDSINKTDGGANMATENKLVTLQVAGTDCGMTEVSKVIVTQALNSHETTINTQKDEIGTLTTSLATADAKVTVLEKDLAKAKEQSSLKVLEATIDSRISLMGKAKKLAPDMEFKGKTETQIMKDALIANNDKAPVADKSDDYIIAYFDVTVANFNSDGDSTLDSVLKDVSENKKSTVDAIAEARSKVVKSNADGFIGNNLGV